MTVTYCPDRIQSPRVAPQAFRHVFNGLVVAAMVAFQGPALLQDKLAIGEGDHACIATKDSGQRAAGVAIPVFIVVQAVFQHGQACRKKTALTRRESRSNRLPIVDGL